MTKKELLNKLNDKTVTDEKSNSLIVRITDTLLSFPDNVEIEDFTSLNEFFNNGGFTQTRLSRDSQPRDIKVVQKELEMILKELQTWVNRQVKSGEVYAAEVALLNQKRRKNIWLRFIVWAFFILVAIIAAVFTGLRLKYGEESYKWLPEIIGCVDLMIGIGFAIYEQVDDYNNNKNHKKSEKQIEDLSQERSNSVAKTVLGKAVVDNSQTVNNYYNSKTPKN